MLKRRREVELFADAVEASKMLKTVCPKCGKTWFSVSGFILFCPDCDASMQGMPVEIIGSNNDVIDVTALVSKKESEDEEKC